MRRPSGVTSGATARTTSAAAAVECASGPSGSEAASNWFGRSRASSTGPAAVGASTTSARPPPGNANRAVNEASAIPCSTRRFSTSSSPEPACSNSLVSTASALTHSAFTSTGLPCRGVTATPPTRASIQVSAVRSSTEGSPAAPQCSSESAGSTPIPNLVPARCACTMSSSTGIRSAASPTSPVTATCRPRACTNQSVPSTVLYSAAPDSTVLASIPCDTVAAYRRSSAAPSRTRPVHRNSPS